MRLEANKPTQLPIDSSFHFGASTRIYIIRERPPTVVPRPIMEELEKTAADSEGGLLGLPETDTELDVSASNIVNLARLEKPLTSVCLHLICMHLYKKICVLAY